MENKQQPNKPKTADYEDYNTEKPQNQNVPVYNSTTEHREGSALPGIENLNHQDGLKDKLKEAKNDDSDNNMTKNDNSLFGERGETDLGGGQRDKNENDKERIIRT